MLKVKTEDEVSCVGMLLLVFFFFFILQYAMPCQRAWEHESQFDPAAKAGQAGRGSDCRRGGFPKPRCSSHNTLQRKKIVDLVP